MPQRSLFSYENALVLILGMTFGVVFFDRQAAANLMPLIKPDLGLDNTQVGMVGSALAITWAISAYLVGWISDRTGRRKLVLIACVVGFSVCSLVSGLARSFEALALSRLLMGLLEGGVMPICLTIMTLESSDRRRAFNAGIVQNGFANLIGNTLGPIVLVAVAAALNWRQAFYLSAVPGLFCALAIWLWVKEPARDAFHVDGTAPAPMSLLQMLRVRNVLVCTLVSIFMVGWMITATVFLPTFLVEHRGLSLPATAGVMSAVGVAALVGGLTLPALSDHLGRKPVMLIGCFGALVAPLAALFFHGPVWALTAFQVVGFMSAGIYPLFMATIPGESLPRAQIATAMGLVVGVGELCGGVFGPIIGGQLADRTALGIQAPLVLAAAFVLIAGCLALLLKETAPARVAAAQARRATVPAESPAA